MDTLLMHWLSLYGDVMHVWLCLRLAVYALAWALVDPDTY